METFWFFRLRFRRAYGSPYDSDFRFSLGHKLSYDSDYDSDSVASENQPLASHAEVLRLVTRGKELVISLRTSASMLVVLVVRVWWQISAKTVCWMKNQTAADQTIDRRHDCEQTFFSLTKQKDKGAFVSQGNWSESKKISTQQGSSPAIPYTRSNLSAARMRKNLFVQDHLLLLVKKCNLISQEGTL